MKDKKYKYQVVLVLNPKTEEKEKTAVLTKISGWIDDSNAKVVANDHRGMVDLVYKIEGFGKGDFSIMEVESEKPIQLKDFNLLLNRESSVIRYLILKK